MSARAPETTAAAILDRYPVIFVDAFGVLVTRDAALEGAARFVEELNRRGHSYWVLTNGAATSAGGYAARYRALGLAIPEERIITSGSLLATFFAREGLAGARTAVFGPPAATAYVHAAGGAVAALDDAAIDVFVVADEDVEDFRRALDLFLSRILTELDAGRTPRLVVPNPDLAYPSADGLAITSGSISAMIEAILVARYGEGAPRFTPLGKPHAPIFEEAIRRAGTRRGIVMLGDQLDTDILGARRLGLDAVLVETGVARRSGSIASDREPTARLPSLLFASRDVPTAVPRPSSGAHFSPPSADESLP